jgi:hypothetical protein
MRISVSTRVPRVHHALLVNCCNQAITLKNPLPRVLSDSSDALRQRRLARSSLGYHSLVDHRMHASIAASLGTLGTFEGSVARLLARKLRRISKEFTATNQKVGSSNLSGRAILSTRCKAFCFGLNRTVVRTVATKSRFYCTNACSSSCSFLSSFSF